jgi:hypothetical protein
MSTRSRSTGSLIALTALTMVLTASATHAQSLGTIRPSQVVTLDLNLGSANCANTGKKFDTLLASDGTEAPFVIPSGQVLVITGIDLLGFGASPGALIQTRIFRGIGFDVNEVAIRESIADSNGRIFHTYQFTPGVVVASGGEVCTNNNANITTTGSLRGFLVRGK